MTTWTLVTLKTARMYSPSIKKQVKICIIFVQAEEMWSRVTWDTNQSLNIIQIYSKQDDGNRNTFHVEEELMRKQQTAWPLKKIPAHISDMYTEIQSKCLWNVTWLFTAVSAFGWLSDEFSFWTCHTAVSPWECFQWSCGRTAALSALNSQNAERAEEEAAFQT